MKEQAERFGEIAADLGGGPFEWATKAEDRTRLWQARHDAYWAASRAAARRASRSRPTFACRSRGSPNAWRRPQRDIDAAGLVAPIVGHVGRRQLPRLSRLSTWTIRTKSRACEAFIDRLVERALAMEGTCTGEHGVGQKKMKYLEAEHGAGALDLMRALKRAIDPHNIMNPGKIVAL